MEQYNTYIDNLYNFSVRYPKYWSMQKDQGALIFISDINAKEDTFRENVNIMVQDLASHKLNLDSYTELSKQLVIDNLTESAILDLKDTQFCGFKAKKFKYQMKMDNTDLVILQFWFIKDDKAYLFTYTAEKDRFETHLRSATDVLESFSFSS